MTNEVLCPHCAFLQVIQPSDRLRELRKYHWLMSLSHKAESQRHHEAFTIHANSWRKRHEATLANTHMKFVRTLNDFFPEGDTAEKDCQ